MYCDRKLHICIHECTTHGQADSRPTQPPTLTQIKNKYQPRYGDAQWLGVGTGMAIPRWIKHVALWIADNIL